jgi:8-oxo-dGTP pyrophosphatase MutT (NUDIX family)
MPAAQTLSTVGAALAAHHPRLLPTWLPGAAVAAVLREGASGLDLLLVERARRRSDPWSGDLAFPGGLAQPSDRDRTVTAIRETREELGLDLQADASQLGRLPDLWAVSPRVLLPMAVSPFVFALKRPARLEPNSEIAAARWVPLGPLLDPGAREHFTRRYLGVRLRFECHPLGEGRLWGLTLRMVDDLARALQS